MKHWKEERIMQVPVPEALLPVAEELEALLQDLADSLSIYAHLAPKDDSREAAAMVLFQQWLEQRLAAEEEQRALHRDYLKQLLALSATAPACAELSAKTASQQLVNGWWLATLSLANHSLDAKPSVQSFNIGLSADALLLEQIFRCSVEDFICFFIQCLADNGADKNQILAIYFLETSGPCGHIVWR